MQFLKTMFTGLGVVAALTVFTNLFVVLASFSPTAAGVVFSGLVLYALGTLGQKAYAAYKQPATNS